MRGLPRMVFVESNDSVQCNDGFPPSDGVPKCYDGVEPLNST